MSNQETVGALCKAKETQMESAVERMEAVPGRVPELVDRLIKMEVRLAGPRGSSVGEARVDAPQPNGVVDRINSTTDSMYTHIDDLLAVINRLEELV